MEQVYLTSTEKSQLQNQKQLYVLLRMIHFIQMYYAYDRIDKSKYESQMTKLLDKYKRFSQIISNFNLDDFCQKFNIPDIQISWAKPVLNNGIHKGEDQDKDANLFIRATSKFIECIDTLTMNFENPVVSELKSSLQSLQLILSKLCSRLKSREFDEKFKSYQDMFHNYVASKSFNETLTESQFQEIKLTVEGLYTMMQHLTN